MDILGYAAPPHHLGPSSMQFPTTALAQADLLRSPHFMFHPLAIQSCCASAVESSFVQSAPLISHLLSDLLQSADTHPHICITAKVPLVPPHQPHRLCGGRRRLTRLAHEFRYHYLFHYSRNPHASSGIRNFFAPLDIHVPSIPT